MFLAGIRADSNISIGRDAIVNIITDGTTSNLQRQSQKLVEGVISIAKQCYRETMAEYTSPLHSVDDTKLRNQHEVAVSLAIERISGTMELEQDTISRIKAILQDMFHRYALINTKKTTAREAIGIDFGTTFCCVAVCKEPNKPVIIINDNGNYKTPSYVAFLNISCDNDSAVIQCGETAKLQASSNPKGTIFEAKRMLGQKFSRNLIQHCIKYWPFNVTHDNDEILVTTGRNQMKTYTPVQITGYLIKHLVEMAEYYLKSPVANAVITVPVNFNAYQKALIRDACELAQLNVLQLVPEPTAASIAYNNVRDSSIYTQSAYCIIIDFGGGTFDVAVLRMEEHWVQILQVGGDECLGGSLIDANIAEYCLAQFKQKRGVDLKRFLNSQDLQTAESVSKYLRQLHVRCEESKKVLSRTDKALIYMDEIHGEQPLSIVMSREMFHSINAKLFEKCIHIIKSVLHLSNLDASSVDEVVLVGGSSRIPVFRQMITDFFQKELLLKTVHEDEAVAAGAAILASEAFNLSASSVILQKMFLEKETDSKKSLEQVKKDREDLQEKLKSVQQELENATGDELENLKKQLQTEQVLKAQALNRLAKIMNRQDLNPSAKSHGDMRKQKREFMKLEQEIKREKEKFQMTLKWQKDLQDLQASLSDEEQIKLKLQMDLDSKYSDFQASSRNLCETASVSSNKGDGHIVNEWRMEGWVSLPSSRNIRRHGWRKQYVVVSSQNIIFYDSDQEKQNPTRVLDLNKVFHVRAVTQGDVIRADAHEIPKIFQLFYSGDGEARQPEESPSEDNEKPGTLLHKGHKLVAISFHMPTNCEVCSKPLWHMFRPPPALECKKCRVKIHKEHYEEEILGPCKVQYDPNTVKELLLLAPTEDEQKLWISRFSKKIQKARYN